MQITYSELVGLFALTPAAIYVAYWKGFTAGKREGWIAGRSLMRIPMNTKR
jgi:hypothetical protein